MRIRKQLNQLDEEALTVNCSFDKLIDSTITIESNIGVDDSNIILQLLHSLTFYFYNNSSRLVYVMIV